MKKLTLLLALAPILFSCRKNNDFPSGENFFFESPQPINDSELNTFPSKFLGEYVDKDSVYLEIQKTAIISGYNSVVKFHKDKIDSIAKEGMSYSNGQLTETRTGKSYKAWTSGDSIAVNFKYRDTIFHFSDSQKAKRINGVLVLSYKDSVYWRVKYLSLAKGTLSVKTFASAADVEKLDSIMKIKSEKLDSISYAFKPSRSEFRKIIKCHGWGYVQDYHLVK